MDDRSEREMSNYNLNKATKKTLLLKTTHAETIDAEDDAPRMSRKLQKQAAAGTAHTTFQCSKHSVVNGDGACHVVVRLKRAEKNGARA